MNFFLNKPSSLLIFQAQLPFFKKQLNIIENKNDITSFDFPQKNNNNSTSSMIQSPTKMSKQQKIVLSNKADSRDIENNHNSIRIDQIETKQKVISLTDLNSLENEKQSQDDVKFINIQQKVAEKINELKEIDLNDEWYLTLNKNSVNKENQNQKLPQAKQLNSNLILNVLEESKRIFDEKIYPTYESYLLISKVSIVFSTLILITRILEIYISSYQINRSLYLICFDIALWKLGAGIAITYLKVFKNFPLNMSLLLIMISLIPQGFGYFFSLSDNWDNKVIVLLDFLLLFIESSQKLLNDINKNLQLGKLLRNHHNKFKGASSPLLRSFL